MLVISDLKIDELKEHINNKNPLLYDDFDDNIFHYMALLNRGIEFYEVLLSDKDLHFLLKKENKNNETPIEIIFEKNNKDRFIDIINLIIPYSTFDIKKAENNCVKLKSLKTKELLNQEEPKKEVKKEVKIRDDQIFKNDECDDAYIHEMKYILRENDIYEEMYREMNFYENI